MKLSIFNFHYIGMPRFPFSGVHSIDVKSFLSIIDVIKKNYKLISLGDFEKGNIRDDSCLITFDDGLKCQFEILLPLIKKYNFIPAIFISGQPLTNKKALTVHKSHFVRAHSEPNYFQDTLHKFIKASNLGHLLNFSDQIALKHYKYDELPVARTKYLLNYVLPNDFSEKFIHESFIKIVKSEEEFCEEWYMSREQISQMHKEFKNIGSHAWSHVPLRKLTSKSCFYELKQSKAILEEIVDDNITSLSYPLGNQNAVSQREASIAQRVGYKFGFTMKRSVNKSLNNPLMINRFDAKDIYKQVKNS